MPHWNFKAPRDKTRWVLFILFVFYTAYIFYGYQALLIGPHLIRQADTLFASYSYCYEQTSFLLPKIIHREMTSGVSIGEFPLWSYLLSLPCKATGVWSETLPKYFSYLFFLFNILIWWKVFVTILSRYFPREELESEFPTFFTLFFFSSLALAHLTIPIPDGFALFLSGAAAFLSLRPNTKARNKIFAALLFALAFAIRPYLLPLFLFLFPLSRKEWFKIQIPRWREFWPLALSLLLSFSFYLFWYRYWKAKSEVLYYNTSLAQPSEILQDMPRIFDGVYEHFIRNQLHFIGVFLCVFALQKWWNSKKLLTSESKAILKSVVIHPWIIMAARWTPLWIVSLIFVIVLKADHFRNHGYYLLASFVFFTFFLFCLVQILSQKWKSLFLVLYALIGITNTYFLFDRKTSGEAHELEELILKNNISEKDRVAIYLGEESNTTYHLYFIKRMGWAKGRSDVQEPCPQGAHWKIWKEHEELKALRCE